MVTPSFSPCLRGSKKKDSLIEHSTQDPNQLLGSTLGACQSMFAVKLFHALWRLEKLASGWGWGSVWFGVPHHWVSWAVSL
jgi:hypothetical protein